MKIQFNSTAPIYLQIVDEIRRQIISGERTAGSKVESVRDLAAEMGVNPNTMQRAFAELERDGLMFAERTSGRFITQDTGLVRRMRESSVKEQIAAFVEAMRKSGFSKDEILRLLEDYLKEEDAHGQSC